MTFLGAEEESAGRGGGSGRHEQEGYSLRRLPPQHSRIQVKIDNLQHLLVAVHTVQ